MNIDCDDFIDCDEWVIGFYSDMVYRLAFSQTRNKSDADDVFQEVFISYINRKPVFNSEEHRKAWLIRVTINCAKKIWASSWYRKTAPLDESISFEFDDELGLHYELMKLPFKYRSIIHLFYYEGYSVQDISDTLNRKPSTVRTQLTRARRKLKDILEEDYDV